MANDSTHNSSADSAARDRRVLDLYEQLLEIEQRLIPTGLHVFGRAADADDCVDLLCMIASFDRPEAGARALPDLIAEGLSLGQYEVLIVESRQNEARLRARERVEMLAREAITQYLRAGADEAANWLEQVAHVTHAESRPVFALLERVRAQLQRNQELDQFARALRGEYIEPGPGADLVQNPSVLPTGRNTHAVNPYSVPSASAFRRAEPLVKQLLARHHAEHGRFPAAMALVLWGLDNIKTQGEGVAQALWLLGVRPVRDRMNRVTDVEPVSLAELQRPRIDVVLTVSGIFRDLFGATMNLLDKAVRAVAQLDEPPELNYVR
ncbi:MAG TPA: cobaltochelatase subunit CobN, partial [Pyrinomonadaceae bacterium]|nr:cobaltochelatase subunit CobN [Pyrinomonadaceae bacterium]